MRYAQLGTTGLRVSELALGGEGLEKPTPQLLESFLDFAFMRGVNYLDIVPADPELRSRVGECIEGGRRRLVLQGHLGAVWSEGEYRRSRDVDECRRGFDDLLTRLKTDYIDILMLHYVDGEADMEQVLTGGLMAAAQALKRSGAAKAIGIATHDVSAARRAAAEKLADVLMFALNPAYDLQPPSEDADTLWTREGYNLAAMELRQERLELYGLCEARGVALVPMKVYGGGDLLKPELSPLGAALTPQQCIAYALSRPGAAAVMLGCKTKVELAEALAFYDAAESQRDFVPLLGELPAFKRGRCLYCGRCEPCPAGLEIVRIEKLLNLALAQGAAPELARGHYELLPRRAADCTGCGVCETRCPFKVTVIDRMMKAKEVFGG